MDDLVWGSVCRSLCVHASAWACVCTQPLVMHFPPHLTLSPLLHLCGCTTGTQGRTSPLLMVWNVL